MVDIPVAKVWADADSHNGKRPAQITVRLYADGKALDGNLL